MIDSIRADSTYEAIKVKALHVLSIENNMLFVAQRKQLLSLCETHMKLSDSTHAYCEENVLKVLARKSEGECDLKQRYDKGLDYLINNRDKHTESDWMELVRKWIEIWDKIDWYEEPVITVDITDRVYEAKRSSK